MKCFWFHSWVICNYFSCIFLTISVRHVLVETSYKRFLQHRWSTGGLVPSMGDMQLFFMYFLNHINKTCPSGKELNALSTAQVEYKWSRCVRSVHNSIVGKRKLPIIMKSNFNTGLINYKITIKINYDSG